MVTLDFSVPAGVRNGPSLEDELFGHVYGSLFRSEEVGIGGPFEGVEAVTDVRAFDVDLRVAERSAATWTSEPLPDGMYTFLGFYDVDGNGGETFEPDDGDPVTLPLINIIPVAGEPELTVTVSFDLVF